MDLKPGDRVKVSGQCPLSTLRGLDGVVINEDFGYEHMVEVKVHLTDYKGPFRFYPWELVKELDLPPDYMHERKFPKPFYGPKRKREAE